MWCCWISLDRNPRLLRQRGLELASECGRITGCPEVNPSTAEQNLRQVFPSPNAFKVAGHSLCPQRFAVTALPRQLQTLPCVHEFAELNSLAMRRRAYHQARREFDISD
jgi:hypothetical protein